MPVKGDLSPDSGISSLTEDPGSLRLVGIPTLQYQMVAPRLLEVIEASVEKAREPALDEGNATLARIVPR